MFNDPIDDKWAEIGVDTVRLLNKKQNPYDEIRDRFWCALAMLYWAMVKRKQIPELSSLDKEKKQFYWDRSEREIHKTYRIMICQAMFMYDLLNG